jgi:hypothetical protein
VSLTAANPVPYIETMRAEIEHEIEEIRQAISLLRRHL